MKVSSVLSLAKNFLVTATLWEAPSALIKSAHLIVRSGLAIVGSSCALFVAAGLMREGNELFEAASIVLLMMLCGAFSFYLGIDLPGRAAGRSAPRLTEENSDTDAAGIEPPLVMERHSSPELMRKSMRPCVAARPNWASNSCRK